MFDQAAAGESRGWAFGGSLALQAAGVAVLALAPLLSTYELDLSGLGGRAMLLAPPPPPAPPPPAAPAPAPAPRRYESDFVAPVAIPDRVAVLHDRGLPVSPVAAMPAPQGLEGGLAAPGVEGVLGMFPGDGDLPLPPPVRVGGNVQSARLVSRVLPAYPPEAVEQHVSGTVRLEAIIGTDGAVRDLRLIEGHPMLAPAALEAVAQWRYLPTRLNGRVVEVVSIVDVNFNLTVIDEKEARKLRRQARRAAGRP